MFDTGSTSFMLICTMLVLLMTPGVAFFYGGLARRKNVVNTMFMSMAIIGVVGVLWIIAGWSFAYGGDGSNPLLRRVRPTRMCFGRAGYARRSASRS